MPRNVEIKARLRDRPSVRSAVESVANGPPKRLHQEDTFFCCEDGRLKLRQFGDGTAELIFYRRDDTERPSESRFSKSTVNDPITLLTVLCDALGSAGVVRKRREVFTVGQTRVHLDDVEDLGDFVELEVVLGAHQTVAEGEVIARDLMAKLGVSDDDLIDVAYVDLLERKNEDAT